MNARLVQRLKALFLDWLLISAYLVLLAVCATAVYSVLFDGVPEMTVLQAQLVAALTSVVPVIIIFSVMESSTERASWGKRRVGLEVKYNGSPIRGSIIRNVLKFLPWQLGHMSTIHGIYTGFDTPFAIICLTLSVFLTAGYVLMVSIRRDGRHLPDLLAGSRVTRIES